MKKLKIVNAKKEELERILEIYAYARKYMKETGNPTQWKDGYPGAELLLSEIEAGRLYVIKQDDRIHAVFTFFIGDDPTYARIEQGNWISDDPYGVIHRVAGDGQIKGIFDMIVEFCSQKIKHLRIDTHKDNKIMQHLILKNGFQKCGIIYAADGTPRIAYEKTEPVIKNMHIEKAMELRNEIPMVNNCAQAIMRVYAAELGIDEDMAASIGSNFGRGMKCGGTCGAITAGLMILGAKGIDSGDMVGRFRREMAEKHDGMTDCADLLRVNAQRGISNKIHCDNMIKEAIELVDKLAEECGL